MIPRDRLLLAGAALIALTGVARSARADEEGKLAAAVREASAPDDKKKAAVALAAKKSPSARKNLEQLLGDESDAWTQEAALHGLVLLGDAAADERAVEFVEAHFTSADHVVEAVKTRKSFTIAALSKRYAKTEGFQARSSFVKIASAVRTKESDAFLRDAIAAKGEAHDAEARALAFAALVEGPLEGLYPLAVELARSSDELAAPALAFLVEKGTAADLPVAVHAIDERKDAGEALLVAAYRGVARWCDAKVQRERLVAAVRSRSEERARAALASLELAPDAEVVSLLARLVRKGAEQRTRIAAALRLTRAPAAPAGTRDAVVPALVSTLKEPFEAKEETPVIANLLTLGFASLFDSIARGWNKKAFEDTLAAIAAALAKRTGASHGDSYEKWSEWAILQGHAVDGRNVIQLIFSPDKEQRRRAHEGAARLVGFKDRADLVAKTAGLANDDGAIALTLAKRLVEKGFLTDED